MIPNLWLRLRQVLPLCWLVLTVFSSSTSFAYDCRNQATRCYDDADKQVLRYDKAAVLSTNKNLSRSPRCVVFFVGFPKFFAAETTAGGGGATIGLGLSEDLSNFRGTGALTYQNGAWQQAGLTTVDWGKAAVDNSWFRMSFNEASQNASAIQFDVSSFSPTYANPGMTSWEFNSVINNPSLLGKTTFIQNGSQVLLNGTTFVKP
jgi:hypothetical protein